MKIITLIVAIVFILVILTFPPGSKTLSDGKTYSTYGFLNADAKKNPNVRYEVSVWAIVWSVILCETIIAPVYFVGYSLFKPAGFVNDNPAERGIIK